MSENTTEVLVGGAVLAVAIGFLVFAGQATGFSTESGDYSLKASFRSVEGVSIGTDVRMAGVKVGTVIGLNLNTQNFRADSEISVFEGVVVPDDSSIQISSEGLLGGTFVEILPGGSPLNYEPGSEIEDTQGAVSLVSLLLKFVSGSEE
ncbi:outer membrane lipid asymmetry maintenance protein MlaD [Pseudohalocynthiibacter aestuariivivens]|jgi:phospholipid/cholesterol/gamma-HCH transport system substrate-binding protein|uniref:Outer membrane lipid asymmetry maintenance protein MlaD n=1 Tax=Pseudohalocynthiibacter aestuariivivens TaxID=1591409 RepID=A0ABV5JEK5_9RHOB|nr:MULTISPECIES: outer membrane lipid asymmetry maintenance protein MlaD [Pseudohalocynthiibacter]MBS9716975.1 outer membrane lipid asymmetry maintenance protein MlaD [Pseudohalocynthiibacter aestuariivivens]MCK0101927.1 outer membrane lipid asymmetry maintenance protein MlaD [Pseudohalocynthiibacter sp. F2068]